MSKKRGLSVEEKRSRLLEVFHEAGEVFVLKEVEKLGVKKGITPQSIKDILQSLVDDDLVHQEKIGIANYFWSFPSEASVMVERDMEKAKARLESNRSKLADIQQSIEKAKAEREDSDERDAKQAQLNALKSEVAELEREMRNYSDHDPEVLEKMKAGIDTSKTAANRWLDNLFALQSWCSKQFQGMESEIKTLFHQNGIDDDIDYLE